MLTKITASEESSSPGAALEARPLLGKPVSAKASPLLVPTTMTTAHLCDLCVTHALTHLQALSQRLDHLGHLGRQVVVLAGVARDVEETPEGGGEQRGWAEAEVVGVLTKLDHKPVWCFIIR